MRESFEQQKKLLYDRYSVLSMDDCRQMLCKLRKRNILMYCQLEHLRHDLLRLKSKRVRCELGGNQTQVEVVETRILKKKEQSLKMPTQNRK